MIPVPFSFSPAAVKADVTDCSRSATVVDGDTCDAICECICSVDQ